DDARQADVLDDQAVIARDLAALTEDDAEQITAESVERNGHGAELQRHDDDKKQNHQKEEALKQEFAESQRPHAQPPVDPRWARSRWWTREASRKAIGSEAGFDFSRSFSGSSDFSLKACGCNWRARSSMAEMMRGVQTTKRTCLGGRPPRRCSRSSTPCCMASATEAPASGTPSTSANVFTEDRISAMV